MPYRIYTSQNAADTSRDPDDYTFKELGYTNTLEKAKEIANTYMIKHYFSKDAKWYTNNKTKDLCITDSGSYAISIIIQKIKIS